MAVEPQVDTRPRNRAGEIVSIPKTQGAPIHLEKSPWQMKIVGRLSCVA